MNDEVRSCPKCGQASVVQVFEWKHTTYGASTGQVTREMRCQSCASWFVVRPWLQVLPLWIAGGILTLFTCVGGLPFLLVAWWRTGVEKTIPVVPGAPVPPIRFRGGPPLRTCGKCSRIATAIRVTRSSHNGLPTGTEYEYQCAGCSTQFVIESPWGQIFGLFSTAVVAGFAVGFLFMAESPGWKYGGSAVASLATIFLLKQITSRFLNRYRNPPLDESTQLGIGF